MPRLIFARHGRTDYNAAGRFQGWLDTSLDELGFKQANLLAEYLSKELKDANYKVFSSPLKRACQTAMAFIQASGRDIKPQLQNGLKEINHGEWNDQLASDIDQQALAKWRNAPHTTTAGPKGESLAGVQERAMAEVFDICSQLDQDEIAVIFAHDAVIRCILLWVLNAPLSSFNALQQHNCAVNVIDCKSPSALSEQFKRNLETDLKNQPSDLLSNKLPANDASFVLVHANLSAHTGQNLLSSFFQAAL